MEEYRKQLGPPPPDASHEHLERGIPGQLDDKGQGWDFSAAVPSPSAPRTKYLPRAVSELMTAPAPEDGTDLMTSADQLMATGRWGGQNDREAKGEGRVLVENTAVALVIYSIDIKLYI